MIKGHIIMESRTGSPNKCLLIVCVKAAYRTSSINSNYREREREKDWSTCYGHSKMNSSRHAGFFCVDNIVFVVSESYVLSLSRPLFNSFEIGTHQSTDQWSIVSLSFSLIICFLRIYFSSSSYLFVLLSWSLYPTHPSLSLSYFFFFFIWWSEYVFHSLLIDQRSTSDSSASFDFVSQNAAVHL